MTESSLKALEGMRDFSKLEWYVIPLLAIVFYIYTYEIKKARSSGNWDAIAVLMNIFAFGILGWYY